MIKTLFYFSSDKKEIKQNYEKFKVSCLLYLFFNKLDTMEKYES